MQTGLSRTSVESEPSAGTVGRSRLMNEVTRFQNTRNDLDQTQSQLNDIDDRVLKIKTKIRNGRSRHRCLV